MTEGYEKVWAEMLQNGADYDPELTIKLMALDRLDRIASALEGIEAGLQDVNATLDNVDQNLAGCISRGTRSDFLSVTGNVTVDN